MTHPVLSALSAGRDWPPTHRRLPVDGGLGHDALGGWRFEDVELLVRAIDAPITHPDGGVCNPTASAGSGRWARGFGAGAGAAPAAPTGDRHLVLRLA